MNVRRILLPLDFSDASHGALSQAEAMARAFKAELVLVHVVEPMLYPEAYGLGSSAFTLEAEARKGALAALEPLARELKSRGLVCRVHIDSGTPAMRLCELPKELQADMIVMSTHGHTGFKHLLIGSTTERVVRRSPVPVLTVKAQPASGS